MGQGCSGGSFVPCSWAARSKSSPRVQTRCSGRAGGGGGGVLSHVDLVLRTWANSIPRPADFPVADQVCCRPTAYCRNPSTRLNPTRPGCVRLHSRRDGFLTLLQHVAPPGLQSNALAILVRGRAGLIRLSAVSS